MPIILSLVLYLFDTSGIITDSRAPFANFASLTWFLGGLMGAGWAVQNTFGLLFLVRKPGDRIVKA